MSKAKPMLSVGLAVALAFSAPPLAGQDPPVRRPRKVALLFGVNKGRSASVPPLTWAEADATSLEQRLEHPTQGWEAYAFGSDKSFRADIIGELATYARTLKKDDTFLLFYAGHGIRNPVNGETYWMPYDATIDSLDATAIRLRHMMQFVAEIKAERKIVLLDHCFSGEAVIADGTDTRSTATGQVRNAQIDPSEVAAQVVAKGVVVIAASRNAAFEADGHGIFTQAILSAFDTKDADTAQSGQPPDSKLSIHELIEYLKVEVPKLAQKLGGSQTIVPSHAGLDITSWLIAERVGAATAASILAQVRRYQDLLTEWQAKNLIAPPIRGRCWRTLEQWQSSPTGATGLGLGDQAILTELAATADSTDPERTRADMLRALVERVIRQEGPNP